ncbi:hypothetical protein PMAYCL1PPCAC_08515 [Pristionchus mayeri]|uniref:Uncharacterized protein n=1 Tax=Pristionchus mayeri TaxID=1317129 RepID=A0AAN4ZII0_9BILA|nr:hypothetical protein PMAYCL1PPCAC_08515 [Pristionchus mayeri]
MLPVLDFFDLGVRHTGDCIIRMQLSSKYVNFFGLEQWRCAEREIGRRDIYASFREELSVINRYSPNNNSHRSYIEGFLRRFSVQHVKLNLTASDCDTFTQSVKTFVLNAIQIRTVSRIQFNIDERYLQPVDISRWEQRMAGFVGIGVFKARVKVDDRFYWKVHVGIERTQKRR